MVEFLKDIAVPVIVGGAIIWLVLYLNSLEKLD
jgi:hypothetical protein